jgi:2-iminobutanoate/2-iminopropanoate deaminase
MKKLSLNASLILLLVLAFGTVALAENPKALYPSGITANGFYSPGIKLGNLVFISGQICDPSVNACGENIDMTTSTDVVMDKILAILEEAKMDFNNVVMVTVYLVKPIPSSEYTAFNNAYNNYLVNTMGIPIDRLPARALIGNVNIPKGSLLEVSVVAGK